MWLIGTRPDAVKDVSRLLHRSILELVHGRTAAQIGREPEVGELRARESWPGGHLAHDVSYLAHRHCETYQACAMS